MVTDIKVSPEAMPNIAHTANNARNDSQKDITHRMLRE